MKLAMRVIQNEDYWRLRSSLQDVFLLNQCQEFSWQAARLDYWVYFGNPHIEHYVLNEAICLWESEYGHIVAFRCVKREPLIIQGGRSRS
jgi:hypothetical protein